MAETNNTPPVDKKEPGTSIDNDAMAKLAKMMSNGPGVFVLEYQHDADCPCLSGGQCNCDPDIYVRNGADWAARQR
jgi:hypothetical protein